MDALARICMTLRCRDADMIAKVMGAGQVVAGEGEGIQIMHNGLRVVAGAYHGAWMKRVIEGLRGHHEPQEECIFAAIARTARRGTLMVELGSFWAYYTLWYLQSVPDSRAFCVEPDPLHMEVGRRNAALNGMSNRIRFHEAWIGGESRPECTFACESTGAHRTLAALDMNGLSAEVGDEDIELLHMDCQGAELGFLTSMRQAVKDRKVRFLIVSTHHRSISGSESTHADCLDVVDALGGIVLAHVPIEQSFSGDGLIAVSFSSQDRRLVMPPLSRNHAAQTLFAEL